MCEECKFKNDKFPQLYMKILSLIFYYCYSFSLILKRSYFIAWRAWLNFRIFNDTNKDIYK